MSIGSMNNRISTLENELLNKDSTIVKLKDQLNQKDKIINNFKFSIIKNNKNTI